MTTSEKGESMLRCAEQNDHQELESLLSMGVEKDYANKSGETAVWFASRNDCIECLKVLNKFGANLDAQLPNGDVTGLWIAAANGHVGVIRTLLEANADPNIPDNRGVTAMWAAASYGYHEIVKALLDAGADVDRARNSGETSLWIACLLNYHQIVELLIRCGADIKLARCDGHTPLMAASEGGFVGIVEMLVANEANVNASDQSGHTALSLAAGNGHDAVVQTLLNSGANPSIEFSEVSPALICPLAQCCAYNKKSTARLLLDMVTEQQRLNAIKICDDLDHKKLKRLLEDTCKFQHHGSYQLDAFPNFSQLSDIMSKAGFTRERARVQAAAADVVQQVYRGYFSKDTVYVLGSFADGWGCNMSSLDGSISRESDIDFTEIMPGQLYHLKGYCQCSDVDDSEKYTYAEGHIEVKSNTFVASRPAMTTDVSHVSPSMDIVSAYTTCCYPPVRIVGAKSEAEVGHFPKYIVKKLEDAVKHRPCHCHLIRACAPNNEGMQLRVSTTILERIIMQSLSTYQGQFYIMLKYLIKRVIGVNNSEFQSVGLKSYHVKSLMLFMLRDTPSEGWCSENYGVLLNTALQLLRQHLTSSSDDLYCMPHFFLENTALFLKKDSSSKEKILEHLNHVIKHMDRYLEMFKDQLESPPSQYLSLHVFTLFPFGFSLLSDSSPSQGDYHTAFMRIKQCLRDLIDVNKLLPENFAQKVEELPQFALTAKICLLVLMHLRAGDLEQAIAILNQHPKSTVLRHLSVVGGLSFENTRQTIWQQLLQNDSLWRICCRFGSKSDAAFRCERDRQQLLVCPACFPNQLPFHERRFYVNFDLLLQLLRRSLLPDEAGDGEMQRLAEDVKKDPRCADFEELYALAFGSSNVVDIRRILREMRKRYGKMHKKTDEVVGRVLELGDRGLQVGPIRSRHDSRAPCFRRLSSRP